MRRRCGVTRMSQTDETWREQGENGLAWCARARVLLQLVELRIEMGVGEQPDLLRPAIDDVREACANVIAAQKIIKNMMNWRLKCGDKVSKTEV